MDFNKPGPGGGDARLHLLNAALLVGLWAFAGLAWGHLPDQIPAHIGPGGVTRWESRSSGVWFLLPIMATFHVLIVYALAGVVAKGGPGVNVPGKRRLERLPPAGRRYALRPMRSFMYVLAAWLLALMAFIQYGIYRAAMTGAAGGPDASGMLGGIAAFLGLFAWAVYRSTRAVHRRASAWEAGAVASEET
jgi:hypothetical protein